MDVESFTSRKSMTTLQAVQVGAVDISSHTLNILRVCCGYGETFFTFSPLVELAFWRSTTSRPQA